MTEAPGRWIPRLPVAKRIAGRLLRAHRSGAIDIGHAGVDVCVQSLTRKFVPTELRKQLGRLWYAVGETLVSSAYVDPTRGKNAKLDDALDALVASRVE